IRNPSLKTAWDNIYVDQIDDYVSDSLEDEAKRICKTVCRVREACLRDAISDNMSEGIRGGYRFHQGAVSRRDAFEIYDEFGLRASVSRRKTNAEDTFDKEV